jgi:hypothetical protein
MARLAVGPNAGFENRVKTTKVFTKRQCTHRSQLLPKCRPASWDFNVKSANQHQRCNGRFGRPISRIASIRFWMSDLPFATIDVSTVKRSRLSLQFAPWSPAHRAFCLSTYQRMPPSLLLSEVVVTVRIIWGLHRNLRNGTPVLEQNKARSGVS